MAGVEQDSRQVSLRVMLPADINSANQQHKRSRDSLESDSGIFSLTGLSHEIEIVYR
jgi:hypothetical protein